MTAPGTRCCCARHGRYPCPQCASHGWPAELGSPRFRITAEGLLGALTFVGMVGSVALVVYLLAF